MVSSLEQKRNITRYGQTISLSSITETEDAYGNVSTTYATATTPKAIISTLTHKEILERFGEVNGEMFKAVVASDIDAKERDRVTFNSHNYIISQIDVTRNESGILMKTLYLTEEVSSA